MTRQTVPLCRTHTNLRYLRPDRVHDRLQILHPYRQRRHDHDDVPERTDESDGLSKDLRGRGFKFVGTTICYAFVQATGMVNDHAVTCFRHQQLVGQ